MIIKPKKRPDKANTLSASQAGGIAAPELPVPEMDGWQSDQERRTRDRRQGYRRIEDKMLITQAHQEANAIRERAYEEGFHQGLSTSQETLETLKTAIGTFSQAADEARAGAFLSAANELAAMAVQVAERILKTEVTCDEALILSLVEDTIKKAGQKSGPGQRSITIRVHPEDVAVVRRGIKSDAFQHFQASLLVTEDPSVDRGSCKIETESGQIDASFTTQLTALYALLNSETRK